MFEKQGLNNPNFKGFMVDNVQENFNVIQRFFGSRDAFFSLVNKECTCLSHWSQSMEKHAKKLIQ
jgi:hypothetical protein